MGAALIRIVDEHLRGCLPPGVPPSYREILGAQAAGRGKPKQIEAHLIMFDDLPAAVLLTKWKMGWSHRWFMSSAVYWGNGRWHREPLPHPDLFHSTPSPRPQHSGGAA